MNDWLIEKSRFLKQEGYRLFFGLLRMIAADRKNKPENNFLHIM